MSIVRLGKTYQVCATCAFWQGPRQTEESCFVFNNRDTGLCCGSSFKDWSMGATSTCLQWQLPDTFDRQEMPTPPSSKY
ncbi:MAG: hypothetical protein PHO83_11660 [Geobacteraceae bacterium]|nr:hypothetical protein [Geobacteraceae bacterium]